VSLIVNLKAFDFNNPIPIHSYRGLMLDTSRHYFSVESIKRTIVGMSHSKLNRFHWHLTDSQSFPFVSKYYPELAKFGAYSSSEIYTHDDVREIANFAQVRRGILRGDFLLLITPFPLTPIGARGASNC